MSSYRLPVNPLLLRNGAAWKILQMCCVLLVYIFNLKPKPNLFLCLNLVLRTLAVNFVSDIIFLELGWRYFGEDECLDGTKSNRLRHCS